MQVWEARENYDTVCNDPESTKDQIRTAGLTLLTALQEYNREIPKGLADEIIDANQTLPEPVASGVEG